jgi:hypothetical protein
MGDLKMENICKNCGQKTRKVDADGYCVGCVIANDALLDLAFYPEKEEGFCEKCGEYFSECDCITYCHNCGDYHRPSESC